jgi:hypothetical protein
MPQRLVGYIERNYLLMQIVRFAPIIAVAPSRTDPPKRTIGDIANSGWTGVTIGSAERTRAFATSFRQSSGA